MDQFFGHLISLIPMQIVNCNLEANKAEFTMIDLTTSNATIINSSSFLNVNPNMAVRETNITIKFMRSYNNFCNSKQLGCFLCAEESSWIIILGVEIKNLTSEKTSEGAITIFDSTIYIDDLDMKKCESLGEGTCISARNSNSSIINGTLSRYFPSCLYFFGGITTIASLYLGNSSVIFSPLMIINARQAKIEDSLFEDNNGANLGGALYLTNEYNDLASIVTIKNCKFINNKALSSGGALSITNQYVQMNETFFKNNSATFGGALFYVQQTSDGNMILKNVTFELNSALLEGGALKYTYKHPEFQDVVFAKNSALYGPNYASYAIRIVFKIFNPKNGYLFCFFTVNLFKASEIYFDSSSDKSLFFFNNAASGQELDKSIRLVLIDEDNQEILSASDR